MQRKPHPPFGHLPQRGRSGCFALSAAFPFGEGGTASAVTDEVCPSHAAQRVDRVEFAGLARGRPAEDDAHRRREAHAQADGKRVERERDVRVHADRQRDAQTHEHADHAAQQRQDDRLDQKLHLNLARLRAQRLAKADLRGLFKICIDFCLLCHLAFFHTPRFHRTSLSFYFLQHFFYLYLLQYLILLKSL